MTALRPPNAALDPLDPLDPGIIENIDADRVAWAVVNQLGTARGVEERRCRNTSTCSPQS